MWRLWVWIISCIGMNVDECQRTHKSECWCGGSNGKHRICCFVAMNTWQGHDESGKEMQWLIRTSQDSNVGASVIIFKSLSFSMSLQFFPLNLFTFQTTSDDLATLCFDLTNSLDNGQWCCPLLLTLARSIKIFVLQYYHVGICFKK